MPKAKISTSEAKRELAMQNRGTGKKVGAKATAQRITAKKFGKTEKKREVAAAKRGGTKPAAKKSYGYSSKKPKQGGSGSSMM